MGNGLFNPPPTVDTTLPDIPIPDFVSTGQQLAAGAAKGGWWLDLWRWFWASIPSGFTLVITAVASYMQALAGIVVDVYTKAQAINSAGFFVLLGALLEDLLATPVEAQALQNAFRSGGNVGALRAVGSTFYDNLLGILQAGGTALPWTATDVPARQFLGFLIEYAIRASNAEVITQLLPEEFRVGEGFKAYGENLEKTLALGRMARRAFQPLMQILIADPLTRKLNSAYTPKQLSEAQYVRAFIRGDIDAGTLQQNLAELGYHPTLQAALIAENTKALALKELLDFNRLTGGGSTAPIGAIQQLGYSPTNAQNAWDSAIEALVDPLRKQFLNELTNELRKGEIDLGTATSLLNSTNLFPQESGWYQQIWSQMLAFPRKRLSESQVEKAFVEGLIDMTTVQNYWIQSGYGADSIQVLTLLLLQRLQGGTKTTSGHQTHKRLSAAELTKAYESGVLTLAQVQAAWTADGYSAVDVAVLTQLLLEKSGQTPQPVSGIPN